MEKKTLVCCSDPGGSNIIFYYLKNKNKKNIIYHLRGASKKIFNKKNIPFKDFCKYKINKIITGTSNTDFEKNIILYGKKKNIKTISFLDHYTNYKKRFIIKKKLILPDEICAHDRYSFFLAKKILKNTKISLKTNYYLKSFNSKKTVGNKYVKILFISEKKIINNQNITKRALHKFFKILINSKRKLKKKIKVRIQLHPNEFLRKYHFNKSIGNLKVVKNISLKKSLNWSNLVVGIHSYALIISKKFKIKTFSILPVGNLKFNLPIKIPQLSQESFIKVCNEKN